MATNDSKIVDWQKQYDTFAGVCRKALGLSEQHTQQEWQRAFPQAPTGLFRPVIAPAPSPHEAYTAEVTRRFGPEDEYSTTAYAAGQQREKLRAHFEEIGRAQAAKQAQDARVTAAIAAIPPLDPRRATDKDKADRARAMEQAIAAALRGDE